MEISIGNSNLLKQSDISGPFRAVITDVREETIKDRSGREDRVYVVHFAAGKPMKFNVVNRQIAAAAFGRQRDDWIGKEIEIYLDPNVMMGATRTGGIRVRIPTVPLRSTPAARPATAPTRPAAPTLAPAPLTTAHEAHTIILDGFTQARTVAKLDEFAKWGTGFDFSTQQDDVQSDAYHAAVERIRRADIIKRKSVQR